MAENRMTSEERALVEEHLDLVHWIITDNIVVKKHIIGLEYYDLAQEGYLLLIKAARTYDAEKGRFPIYARIVIRNGLFSYCRAADAKHRRHIFQMPSGEPSDEDEPNFMDTFNSWDDTTREVEASAIINTLESFLPEYSGVARKGLEAIILKVKGYNGADIAEMYGVDQYNVGAWISRAKQKLLDNKRFAACMQDLV